jgi:aminoglycoside phosphotransferase (APT) family kinase protein
VLWCPRGSFAGFVFDGIAAEAGRRSTRLKTLAGRLDATVALFATREAKAASIEVACHNDLSPCNTMFRNGQPVALTDFDPAAPGSRAFDLGYAAWL